MPEDKKTVPKQSSGLKTCLIIVGIVVGVIILTIVAWILLQNYLNPKQTTWSHPGGTASPTPTAIGPLNIKKTPSPSGSVTTGNWTLNMSDTTVSTSPATSLDGKDSGQVSFQMPSSGGFTATGDWSGESSGTSGPSTVSGTVNGKMTITGEVKNGKLHFTVSYAYDHCATTITTPIGSNTDQSCPASPPTSHSLDIDTSNGATAAYKITSAAVNGTENWTLRKTE